MATRTIAITEFKAHLLKLAGEVAVTGDEIVVTRHGRPLVKLIAAQPPDSLIGSLILPDSLNDLFSAFDDLDEEIGAHDPFFGDDA